MIPPIQLRAPGLFITGTDTGVGKTVITCAIARALLAQRRGARVGVCKPFATGCRRDREGLVSEDAEALAHFADTPWPLDVVNPVRFVPPVAPGVAGQMTDRDVDWADLVRTLELIDGSSDFFLIEGVGGLLVPLDRRKPDLTVLDLIRAVGYPVVVVARAGLGTLNHTAMTVRLLRSAGCAVAGLVVNGYEPDVALHTDASMSGNREWLQRMNRLPVLATCPKLPEEEVQPQKGIISASVLEAVALTYWPDVAGESEGTVAG